MKILHSFIVFSIEIGSGTTEFMYQVCKAQAKIGLKPTILSGDHGFDKILAGTLDGVNFQVIKTWFHKQGFSIMPDLFIWCRKNLQKYDVVHMHVYRTFQNIVLYYYCRKYKIPYIIDAHGSVPYFRKKIILKKLFDWFIGRSMLKNASKLLAESEIGIQEYKKINPQLSDFQLKVIYPSFNLKEFSYSQEKHKFRKLQNLPLDTNMIIFVGRLSPIKGLEFLLKSFAKFLKKLPNSKLYLIGDDGGSGYISILKKLISDYKLEESVVFTGFLTGKHKHSAIIDANVLIQCSLQEQGPRVPFDAVLLGTPVIVTDHTGSGEYVKKFNAGELVEYDNCNQLCDILHKILNNQSKAREQTNNAAIKIKEEMSTERVISQYQDLYLFSKKHSHIYT